MSEDQGVTPTGSGYSPKGGAAKASPAKPSIPNAGDPALYPVVGRFHDWTSKRGVRFLEFEADHPYAHSFFVEVTADNENDSDDDLNDALLPYLDKLVQVVCAVSASGELFATPSMFSISEAA